MGNLELEKMRVRKLVEEDKEVLLRQFAIDWGFDFPEARARCQAKKLHPARPGDDDGKSRPPAGAALCGAGEDDGGATSRMGAAMGTADAVAVSAAPSTAADAVGSGADAGSAADSSAC